MTRITVTALGGGWSLEIDGVANAMLFRSGARAEAAARAVARRLALAGLSSLVTLYFRDGKIAGHLSQSANEPSDPPPQAKPWKTGRDGPLGVDGVVGELVALSVPRAGSPAHAT